MSIVNCLVSRMSRNTQEIIGKHMRGAEAVCSVARLVWLDPETVLAGKLGILDARFICANYPANALFQVLTWHDCLPHAFNMADDPVYLVHV
ncbi:hypothetical protein FISHEDRAFT_69778 [Fistulina hepatica ATCC 64428]|uniref:Uncharacterized protein n=1 Tax=Fistulina hepatica ATCC 64428 TaxID=1128425 RepID=A0A0D7AL85_9AGAR|nr:hypothetical protein FISHEDRAFT_69778 [Fistulina hepatica ATCC 64428]